MVNISLGVTGGRLIADGLASLGNTLCHQKSPSKLMCLDLGQNLMTSTVLPALAPALLCHRQLAAANFERVSDDWHLFIYLIIIYLIICKIYSYLERI